MPDEKKYPQLLSLAQKEELIAALEKKGVPRACPMCVTNSWTIADGYFNNTLQANPSAINLGGVGIPTVAIICSNCGFISQHAIGVLGFLPNESQAEDKK